MKSLWQAATILLLGMISPTTAEEAAVFEWKPPVVARGVFTGELGMLDSERDDFATNLAIHAVNRVAASRATPPALAEARRMLALAQHLSPRNKRALIASFQLAKGILPEAVESNYSPESFARLLLTRGQLLEKQGGAENQRLARLFIDLAAEMDPTNEDAVYASELRRIDHGAVDWKAITDAADNKSEPPAP